MDNQKVIIESLAMDLKRVAIGLQRGSNLMADKFMVEAFKRKKELEKGKSEVYLKKLLSQMEKRLKVKDERVGEDALMLSTLFQNYSLKILI